MPPINNNNSQFRNKLNNNFTYQVQETPDLMVKNSRQKHYEMYFKSVDFVLPVVISNNDYYKKRN